MAILREKPSAPTVEPANTSAMPPPPSRRSRRYFPETPDIGSTQYSGFAGRGAPVRAGATDPASARDQRFLAALAPALPPDLEVTDERLGELGIELGARTALDLADRDLVRQRTAVGAIGGHRVVGIRDRDDAADERDILAA